MFNKMKFALWIVTLCAAAPAVIAQVSTANMSGVVHDAAGALVPGATVDVTQTATNTAFHATTDERGAFTLPSVPTGPYVMHVAAPGFAKYDRTNIVLTVGQVASFDVSLQIGGTTETVTVTSGAPLVDQTEPTLQTTVDQATVTDLPLNGRNPGDLVYTVGGVSNTVENNGTGQLASTNQLAPAGVTIPGSIAPAINGVRGGGVFFALDGATNVDPLNVIGGPFPDPDATQEFQVVTGTYGSRYVSAAGGSINIISRSGSNAFHGTVFEFLRNGAVNAENAILAQPDILKRNQFGGTIGGPVFHDKLFFFGSYQGTRIAKATPEKYLVPTAAERTGTFQACAFGAGCNNNIYFPVNLATLPPIGGPNVANPVNANFFNYKGSGNALIPLPNSGGNSFIVGVPTHNNGQQLVGRLDYQANAQHRFFARYYTDHTNTPAVNSPTAAPYDIFDTAAGFQQYWDSAAVGETWNPNASWILDTRLSFLNIVANQTPPSSANFTSLGAMGANITEPANQGIGINVIGSTIPPETANAQKQPRTNFTLSEDVIHTLGNHEITFGGILQRIHAGQSNGAGQTGVVIYAGVYTSILGGIVGLNIQDPAFADFYLGHPIVFIQGDGFFSSDHGWLPGVYAQDKYRITNRLTATYGLRYDPYIPYKVENNHISCFNAGEQSTVYTNAPTGLIYPGDPNCPTGGVNGYYKQVQPRVGLAYQLNQKGTQAIRAGYGLYAMQVPLNALGGFQAFPFTRQYTLTNPFQTISDPYGSNGITTNPFASGFQSFGYNPPSNVAFPSTAPNVANFAPSFRPGYIQQWSLSYQTQFGANDSVELAYVGTKGSHLPQNFDQNEPNYIAGVSTGAAGSCGSLSSGNLPTKGDPCSSTSNEQARRPYAGIATLSTEAAIGYSNYNGLQLTYKHRLAAGLDVNSNFTWSKCIDNGSNPGSTGSGVGGDIDIDPRNPNFSRGLCDFDQPYNWRTTLVWAAPRLLTHGRLVQTALGSWIWSGNVALDSGQPFSISTGSSDNSLTGTSLDRADYVPNTAVYSNGMLSSKAFALNATGTLGNTPRNGFRSQGNFVVDTALMKDFKLTERLGLQFRAEAFNVLNHANYYAIVNTPSSPGFGTYQEAREPRQLQFALKLMF